MQVECWERPHVAPGMLAPMGMGALINFTSLPGRCCLSTLEMWGLYVHVACAKSLCTADFRLLKPQTRGSLMQPCQKKMHHCTMLVSKIWQMASARMTAVLM